MPNSIKGLRDRIDKIDEDIIKKLSERKKLAKKIGELKSKSATKVIDKDREERMIHRYENLCEKYQLQFSYVLRIFKIIIIHSRRIQNVSRAK